MRQAQGGINDVSQVPRKTQRSKKNEAQILLEVHLNEFFDATVVPEYKFHDERRWKFDLAVIEPRLAFEIEGGAFTSGRHTRGQGFVGDMDKYNTAAMFGWKVLRFTPEQVKKGRVIEFLRKYRRDL